MVKINSVDLDLLAKAVVAWTGYQSASFPSREKSSLSEIISSSEIENLMALILALENDFYESNAYQTAPSLKEMGEIAAKDFCERYPMLPPEIATAFAWCYTFDYK